MCWCLFSIVFHYVASDQMTLSYEMVMYGSASWLINSAVSMFFLIAFNVFGIESKQRIELELMRASFSFWWKNLSQSKTLNPQVISSKPFPSMNSHDV